MLLHVRPRLYSPFKYVALVDMQIDPLGLRLVGGVDLATRRPYPNPYYVVACRKQGHRAIDGILIETPQPLDEWHYTARWDVEAQICVTHHVHYKLLDHDFDAASDDRSLWGGLSNRNPELTTFGQLKMEVIPEDDPLYYPTTFKESLEACRQSRMKVIPEDDPRDHQGTVKDSLKDGSIIERRQTFNMPTIERERILDRQLDYRAPQLSAAFVGPFK